MNSIWFNDVTAPSFEPLSGNCKTDVLIVGGGIAGLLTAYKLTRAGIDCMLIEASRICRGVSGNTTAKITLQHGLIYDRLIRSLGIESVRIYLDAEKKSLEEYERLCSKLDCDYEKRDTVVYSLDDARAPQREAAALCRLGVSAELTDASELPFHTAGAVKVRNQAQFHPLKFAYAIAQGLPIYENTKAEEILPDKVITNRGEIKYEKLIIATHFPMLNKHGWYFLKMYQHRSYLLALKGAPTLAASYVDASGNGLSFRKHGDLLLLGGGGHRTGKRGGGFDELLYFKDKLYPDAELVGKWATQDCMTLDGLPYVGRYSKSTPQVYVTTGFNKWGMSSSMTAAELLTRVLLGESCELERILSPSRSVLKPQLAVNVGEAILGLITPTAPRCPHLGCALKYNPEEHSWDCPCHGSRFAEDGELLDNPSNGDLKKKPR